MSTIRDVHSYLQTLLGAIAVTDPVSTGITRVYKFVPKARAALGDLPCAILTYEQEPVLFKPAFLHKPYRIHIQVFVAKAEAEADQSADIASAILDKIILALSASQNLNGTVSVIRQFRGASPETLTVLEWAGTGYVGLDLYLEVTITEAGNHAA
jgi:hypothetical protein